MFSSWALGGISERELWLVLEGALRFGRGIPPLIMMNDFTNLENESLQNQNKLVNNQTITQIKKNINFSLSNLQKQNLLKRETETRKIKITNRSTLTKETKFGGYKMCKSWQFLSPCLLFCLFFSACFICKQKVYTKLWPLLKQQNFTFCCRENGIRKIRKQKNESVMKIDQNCNSPNSNDASGNTNWIQIGQVTNTVDIRLDVSLGKIPNCKWG